MESTTADHRTDSLATTLALTWRATRATGARETARGVKEGFDRNELLTFASAIAFQGFFAVAPMLLVAAGLIGLLGLEEVWNTTIVPQLQANLTPTTFAFVNEAVLPLLTTQRILPAVIGAAFGIWKVSSAVRAAMGALNGVYAAEETRGFWRRIFVSHLIALAVIAVLAAAVFVVEVDVFRVSPLAPGFFAWLSLAGRWLLATALLVALIAVLVRFCPDTDRPVRWIGFGAVLAALAVIGMSIAFRIYVTQLADFASVFGNLATLIILLEYFYLSSIVLLAGLQIDALARRRVEG